MKKIILVADGDHGIRELLEDILPEYVDAIVVLAQNGQEAMERLTAPEATAVDLVITGVSMDPVNGVELTATIKSLCPKLPVIMLSGAQEPNGHLANVFMLKPFDAHVLFETINRLIAEASL